jgi:transposase
MPKPYSLDLRERVFRYADEGHSCRAAAAHFGVSVSFVVNLVKAFRMRGSLAPKPQLMELETDRQISASGL